MWIAGAAPDPARVRPFIALRSPAGRELLATAPEGRVLHTLTGDELLAPHARRIVRVSLRVTLVVVLL
jgi:hypothetical protein